MPSKSYILIEGSINKNPAGSDVDFIAENGMLHAFSDCKYLLNGVEIDRTRNLGCATTLKGFCSLTPDDTLALQNAGRSEFPNIVQTSRSRFNTEVLNLGSANKKGSTRSEEGVRERIQTKKKKKWKN